MTIAVLGAGAFGTALAVALARAGRDVTLWGRNIDALQDGENPRLPGVRLDGVTVTSQIVHAARADIILAAVPTQALSGLLTDHADALNGKPIVACCKGIEVATGLGPTGIIAAALPRARPAILSGPSFAADIGRGFPTALTLAAKDGAKDLQQALATPVLRLYRSDDPVGVELGGALKNVIAIACGGCIGEGMGDSARAALMTRGFAEMQRLACHFGANPDTLTGLSGLGDLALTCTSEMSRNYRFGLALGRHAKFDRTTTVEGVATARAATDLAQREGLDLPITAEVTRISNGDVSVAEAIQALLSRPLRAE